MTSLDRINSKGETCLSGDNPLLASFQILEGRFKFFTAMVPKIYPKNGTSGARTEKPNTLFNRNGDPGPKEIFLTIRAPILKLFNTPFKELGAVFWKVITYRDPISL